MSATTAVRVQLLPPARLLARGWPLGRAWAALPPLAIALVALAVSAPGAGRYAEWVVVSAWTHEALGTAGPLICLWAGATGYFLAARAHLFYGSAGRSRGRQFTSHVLFLTLSAYVAVLVGLTPALYRATTTATWGRLSLCDLTLSLAGVAVLVAVSFTIGSRLPDARGLLLLPLGAVVYVLLPRLADRAFSVTDPVQSWWSSARFAPNPVTTAYFVAFAGTVVVWAWQAFDQRGRRNLWGTVVPAVATLLLVATPFVWRPDLYVLRSDPAPTCVQVTGTPVCVHPAHDPSLPMLSSAVGRLTRAAGTPLVAGFTDQDASDDLDPRPGEVMVPVTPQLTRESVDARIVQVGLGLDVCGERFPSQTGRGVPAANIAQALASRLLGSVGDRTTASQFAAPVLDRRAIARVQALSTPAFRHLLARSRTKIARCDLSWADL